TSSTSSSNKCAAINLAFSTTLSVAMATAFPPTASDREPYVPQPIDTERVSLKTKLISSYGIPNLSATICVNVVSCALPCGDVPVNTVTVPLGCTRTVDFSQIPPWKPIPPATGDGPNPDNST